VKLKSWQIEQIKREVSYQAMRSSGPGGQSVNRTESAARLIWRPEATAALLNDDRAYLIHRAGSLLTSEGGLHVKAQEHKVLSQNKQEALARLIALIERLLTRPKVRLKSKPTRASLAKRRESKRHQAQKKQGRRRVFSPDS
jgi:ribosome-associated protein